MERLHYNGETTLKEYVLQLFAEGYVFTDLHFYFMHLQNYDKNKCQAIFIGYKCHQFSTSHSTLYKFHSEPRQITDINILSNLLDFYIENTGESCIPWYSKYLITFKNYENLCFDPNFDGKIKIPHNMLAEIEFARKIIEDYAETNLYEFLERGKKRKRLKF